MSRGLRLARTAGALVCVVAALAGTPETRGGERVQPRVNQTDSPPKLVVLLVVDQMRADYIARFKDDWTAGFKRLLTQGAWFSRAAYPFLTTFTCSGHATIATGTFPRSHGIIDNGWYDRKQRRLLRCTEGGDSTPVRYGDFRSDGGSAVQLQRPTFADEMRKQRKSRVVSLSVKARSAIMMAGHGGEAVTWLADSFGGWETSSAFAKAPVPFVRAFLQAHPIAADYGARWVQSLPLDRYAGPDAAEGEAAPRGWTPIFPHVLRGSTNSTAADEDYLGQWERSPFADEYLARFAAFLTERFELGQRETSDILAVSFSSPDLVGHAFGPRSQEVQDMYVRLDRTIGQLLERLDILVGKERYVVVLTSDHGVSDIPEQLKQQGLDGGRVSARRLTEIIEGAAEAAGPGTYVDRIVNNDVYFAPTMYEKASMLRAVMTAIVSQLQAQPGIARAIRKEDLRERPQDTTDPVLRAARLSYVPARSGDLVLVLKPGWVFVTTGTTHGSVNEYDQQVPIIFMGPGIKAGEYQEVATPADIAPTLGVLSGIHLPGVEGRPLTAALSSAAVGSR